MEFLGYLIWLKNERESEGVWGVGGKRGKGRSEDELFVFGFVCDAQFDARWIEVDGDDRVKEGEQRGKEENRRSGAS